MDYRTRPRGPMDHRTRPRGPKLGSFMFFGTVFLFYSKNLQDKSIYDNSSIRIRAPIDHRTRPRGPKSGSFMVFGTFLLFYSKTHQYTSMIHQIASGIQISVQMDHKWTIGPHPGAQNQGLSYQSRDITKSIHKKFGP